MIIIIIIIIITIATVIVIVIVIAIVIIILFFQRATMIRGLKLWKLLVGLTKEHTRNRDEKMKLRFTLIFIIYILPEMNSGLRCQILLHF